MVPIIGALGVLTLVILLMYGIAAFRQGVKNQPLGVPEGSVRSILAMLIVGGFLIFLFFGSGTPLGDNFDKVLAAYAALVGSVTGFYFGTRPGGTSGGT
jgi:hypothetical protein